MVDMEDEPLLPRGVTGLFWEVRPWADGGRYYYSRALGEMRLQAPPVALWGEGGGILATPRRYLGDTSATPRPHLGHTSAIPRPHLGHNHNLALCQQAKGALPSCLSLLRSNASIPPLSCISLS